MTGDERLDRVLRASVVPAPPPDAAARACAAAAPLLAVHARRASLRSVLAPVLAALVPLPVVLLVDVVVVQALYAVLAAWLPAAVSAFVVWNYALLLVLLLATTYAAVPLLVDRQLRAGLETMP
jgi:hypothetical protein